MGRGRPTTSEIRKNMLEILAVKGQAYGYELHKLVRHLEGGFAGEGEIKLARLAEDRAGLQLAVVDAVNHEPNDDRWNDDTMRRLEIGRRQGCTGRKVSRYSAARWRSWCSSPEAMGLFRGSSSPSIYRSPIRAWKTIRSR